MRFLKIGRFLKAAGAQALLLAFAWRHPATPWTVKIGALLLLAYALSPLDLLPDFAMFLGLADDLTVLLLGIPFLVRRLPPEALAHAQRRVDRLFGRTASGR